MLYKIQNKNDVWFYTEVTLLGQIVSITFKNSNY